MSAAHIMLDLETLGTRPGCKILSLGAVEFDRTGIRREHYDTLDIGGQLGLEIDPRTLLWWMDQQKGARTEAFRGETKLMVALSRFEAFCDGARTWAGSAATPEALCLWANGASFDIPILEHAYLYLGAWEQPPWKFWEARCFRTLKNLAPTIERNEPKVAHNALYDARAQALTAIKILNHLNAWE